MMWFSKDASRGTALATALSLFLLATGCYKKVHIKPSEAKKLDEAYSAQTARGTSASGASVTVYEQSVLKLERADGRIYRMVGAGDLILTTKDGKEVMFKHPLSVEMDQDTLKASGTNRAKTAFERDNLEDVIVRDLDENATSWAWYGGFAGVSLAVGITTLLLVTSSSP